MKGLSFRRRCSHGARPDLLRMHLCRWPTTDRFGGIMTTPSEQLRQAAETLREMAEEATGNRWNVHPDYLNEIVAVVEGDELYQVLPVSDTIKQADAALIALMDPTLAGLVADWLDVERVECDALAMHRHNDGSGIPLRDAEREVYRNHPALALAEHINGRTHG